MTSVVEHVLGRLGELARIPREKKVRAAVRLVALAAEVAQLWNLGFEPDARLRRSLVQAAKRCVELGGGFEGGTVLGVAMPIAMHWRNGVEYPRHLRHLLGEVLKHDFRLLHRAMLKARAA